MRTPMRRLLSAVVLLMMIATLMSGCLQYPHPSTAPISETPAIASTTTAATATPTPAPTPSPQLAATDSGYKPFGTPNATAASSQWGAWLAEADAVMPAVIPVSTLFAPPQYVNPALSPDGKSLLVRVIAPDGSYDVGVVVDLATGDETQLDYPAGVAGVPSWAWAQDSKHVLLSIDRMGDENYGLFSIDIKTNKATQILYEQGVRVDVQGLDEKHPNQVLITQNKRNKENFDLYRADISTGALTLVMENPGNIAEYLTDRYGALRGVRLLNADGSEDILLAKDTAKTSTKFVPAEWTQALHIAYEDTSSSTVFGFSPNGDKLYYTDTASSDTVTLTAMDVKTLQSTPVYNDPAYDISSVWFDLKLDKPTAITVDGERSTWKALDPSMQPHIDKLAKAAAGDFSIVSSSSDDSVWLVGYTSDTGSLAYALYTPATGNWQRMFTENPALDNQAFAAMEPFHFTSSDGLTLHGYATFPVGMERKNLPMVLLVHGGPQARDDWGFTPEVQFLANRGYLVVQVNFRGSTGFGKKFLNAGDKQWGAAMQQDLTDAVNYAIAQGWANPKRVAIMGGSYGGYAALAGAAFTPDVYACAVDMFGPSSLLTLLQSVPDYWKPMLNQMYRTIGDPKTDEAMLKERSPLYHVDNIKIPLLIAQGGNDVRVKPQESEQIVQALKARNLPVEYQYFPNSGHGLNSTEDLVKFYTACEQFLAAHIGGRVDSTTQQKAAS